MYAQNTTAITAKKEMCIRDSIYGLGGRDVRVESIQHVFAELEKIAATGEVGETYRYLDVRE